MLRPEGATIVELGQFLGCVYRDVERPADAISAHPSSLLSHTLLPISYSTMFLFQRVMEPRPD